MKSISIIIFMLTLIIAYGCSPSSDKDDSNSTSWTVSGTISKSKTYSNLKIAAYFHEDLSSVETATAISNFAENMEFSQRVSNIVGLNNTNSFEFEVSVPENVVNDDFVVLILWEDSNDNSQFEIEEKHFFGHGDSSEQYFRDQYVIFEYYVEGCPSYNPSCDRDKYWHRYGFNERNNIQGQSISVSINDQVSSYPLDYPYNKLDVVFSEVNWAGTDDWSSYVWVELYNNTNSDIILDDKWTFNSRGTLSLDFYNNVIPAKKHFLIEYKDIVIPDKVADMATQNLRMEWGSMGRINLKYSYTDEYGLSGSLTVDQTPENGWPAGSTIPALSMERMNINSPGTEPSNWKDGIGDIEGAENSGDN